MAKQKEFYSLYTAQLIEDTLVRSNEKPFVIYQDSDNECYRFFTTKEKADAWIAEYNAAMSEGRQMDETIRNYEFPGTYIPGTPNYSAEFLNVEGDGVSNIEGASNNIIRFRPIIYNRTKENTEEMVEYYVNISNSGNAKPTIYDFVRSGELVELDISDHISLGDNDIVINIKGRASGASKMINMRYKIFRLYIESSFNISKVIEPNKDFPINYSVQGSGQKEVYFYIDGIIAADHPINANDPNATLTLTIANSDGHIGPGKHSLQIYAVTNGYPSDLLYYEFIVGGITERFTTCLVSYRFPSGTNVFIGNAPKFTGTQYVVQKLDWAYYTNDNSVRNPKVTWRLYDSNGVETHLATRNADIVDAEIDKMPDPVEFMPFGYGQYMLQALIEGYDYMRPNAHVKDPNVSSSHDDPEGLIACYSIWVDQNMLVQEAIDNLEFKGSGLGRSNDEPDNTKLDFSYNGIKATFHNFTWNNRNGYIDNAVLTTGNAWWELLMNPFDNDHNVLENGNTVEIDFATDEVRDESKPVFLIGEESGFHLAIYATRAELKTASGVGPEVRFRGGERHRLSFVTYPDIDLVGQQRRFMMLYVDGIRSAVVQYPSTENLLMNGSTITIGNVANPAMFKLYNFRSYKGILQAYNILNNFIIDSGSNIAALVKRNDVYIEGSHDQVNVDKLKSILPVWELTGPFDRTLLPSQDKTEFFGQGKYTDTEHPDLYLEGEEMSFKPSGESSLSDRMAKGIHIKFNKGSNKIVDSEGKQWNGNRWTPFKGNAPERKIRINADGLESSHVHNMVLQNLINEVFPKVSINGQHVLRTPAQEYADTQYSKDMAAKYGGDASDYPFPYKINYAADWKPVAVVWRPDASSQYRLLGIYSMGEEKKADFAHGRRSIYLKKLDNGTLDPYDMYPGVKGEKAFDNEGIMLFEMVRDSALTLMTNTSTWNSQYDKDIEKIYQDDDDDKDAAETAMQWQTYKDEVIQPVASLYDHCEKINGVPYMRGNQQKFHELLFSGRFNVWSFCAARAIIRRCGLTDTYVRNSQWVRFPKQFAGARRDYWWWFAYWDLDMAFGLQQPSGALVIEPGLDREAKVGDNFVFTGKRMEAPEGSWFWDAFDEEISIGKQKLINAGEDANAIAVARLENLYYMMQQMENGLADAGFTVTALLKAADALIDKYGESLYNADGQSKYLDSFGAGSDYLLRLQGSRKSHLHWWAYESFERWDSEMVTANYQANAVALRVTQNSPDAKIKIKAGGHSFFGWGLTTTVFQSGVEKNTGDEFEFVIGRSLNGNDPIQIYSPNKIEELDCSSFADRIGGNIELAALVNENTGTTIRKINIGVPKGSEVFNEFTGKTWTGIDNLSTVEEFNIQGYRYVSQSGTLEFNGNALNKTKGMTSLNRFYAAGATGLTGFQPAAGVRIDDYQLPTTITSMVLVDATINPENGITWWNDWTKVSLPSTLKVLQMSGMGDDKGAHVLFKDYLNMLSTLSNDQLAEHRISYTQINITDVNIDLIMTLANMKLLLNSSVNITGYIHCDTEYTPEQMDKLMKAFGTECFNTSNAICFDCNSSNLIISANGDETIVYTENGKVVIEVKQGSRALINAIGFGHANSNATYTWSKITDSYGFDTGAPLKPEFSLEPGSDDYLLHYKTGLLTVKECIRPQKDYNLYVESSSGASGYATLRIIRRTYPTDANIEFIHSSQVTDQDGSGTLQITSRGLYFFLANHTPEYDGTMLDENGGNWELLNAEGIAKITTMDYTQGHSKFDQMCIDVYDLPEEPLVITIKYNSKWKGGAEINNITFQFVVIGTISDVLTPSAITGNPQLYIAVDLTGIRHGSNSFNNIELRALNIDFDVSQMIAYGGGDISELKSLYSGPGRIYYIISMLRNITGLTINNAPNLNDVVDVNKLTRCKFVNLSGTYVDFKAGNDNKLLSTIVLGSPKSIELNNCPQLNIS